MLWCFVMAVCAGWLCGAAWAGVPSAQPAPAQVTNAAPETAVVAVPEPSAKAVRHYHSLIVLVGATVLWNLLLPAVLLFSGLSARIRSWAERGNRNWYWTFVYYGLVFGLVYFVASLPLEFYAGFIHPHGFDLSNQTLGRWLGNTLKAAAVTMIAGLALGWFPFFVLRKSPRRWWLYLGLLAAPCLCAQLLLEPVLIDPLFHRFQPVQNPALEAKILAEAARAGIAGSRVYEVNMSLDTKTENAYVTGFLGTKRIVFWDTTTKDLSDDELLFILGHEMGHYVLGHLLKMVAFESGVILLSLYLAWLLAGPVIGRFKHRWGFSAPSDFAALPLGLLALQLFGFADMPILMAFSRHLEHEADRFGLELTQNNQAAATSFVKLEQKSLAVPRPNPLIHFWYGSHPTPAERIDFCNRYRPWETGQPLKYEKYFK